jgi:hypothetical protein
MEYKYINFPTRIKYAKENPVVDFYKKCMKMGFEKNDLTGVQVWAFEVNAKDYKKLANLLKTHIKKSYPDLPYKKLRFEKELILLDIGPRICKDVEQGLVRINLGELYGDSES